MQEFHALKVAEVQRETPDAISVVLEVPPDLAAAFAFKAGQHLPVRARFGGAGDGAAARRTYSICAHPGEGRLRIAVKRVAGGAFSNWANDHLKAGDTLEVMPPQGRFVLPPGDGTPRRIVAFAAGAGITPILAIVTEALAREPATDVLLVYGNRSPETILFGAELEALKDRHLGRFTLVNVLSHNEESSAPLLEGRITADKVRTLAATLFDPGAVAHVFLCGPGSMIRDVRNALLEAGVPRERVHHEFFAPAARTAGAVAAPVAEKQASAARPAEGVEAVAILDGIRHRFTVPPGVRVVDAALAAGIRVPYACKGGMCCTCRARLVEGKAEMAVNYSLEPWEIARGFILTCQAVPQSDRIVLDYDAM